ncbi:MAG: flagellar protein FlaG, partial [Nitrospira sp.]|nr:flagellar protein FlaG [Nitrospira sp.]
GRADLLAAFLKEHRSDRASASQQGQARKTEAPRQAGIVSHLDGPDGGESKLSRAMADVEKALKSAGLQVQLLVDRETERVVVKVVKESGEVIRQFPPQEILELAKYLSMEQENRPERGVLLEERA